MASPLVQRFDARSLVGGYGRCSTTCFRTFARAPRPGRRRSVRALDRLANAGQMAVSARARCGAVFELRDLSDTDDRELVSAGPRVTGSLLEHARDQRCRDLSPECVALGRC